MDKQVRSRMKLKKIKELNSSYSKGTANVYVRDSDGRRNRCSTPPLKQPTTVQCLTS